MSEKFQNKKIKVKTILTALIVLLIAYVITIGIIVYFFSGNEHKVIQKTIRIIPYPAAISKSGIITVDKLYKQLSGSKKFYESQDFSKVGFRVDFSTEDGKKRLAIKEKEILNKLIDDFVIRKEAEKKGIIISNDLVDQEVDRKLKEYGTGDYLKNNLERLYGWTIDDFKENIVKPDLYQEKLFVEIKKADSSYGEAKNKIGQAKNEILKGLAFSEAAKKYSEGESAKNGGSLGWFSKDQMLPEVAAVIFNFEKNQQSDIIESPIGFHIVKVEDRKNQNSEEMLKISQIFVPFKSFPVFLGEMKKNYDFLIMLKKFKWNNENKEIEFQDNNLKNYEEDLIKNPINDPSVIF